MALTDRHDARTETDLVGEVRRAAERAGMSLGEWLDAAAGNVNAGGAATAPVRKDRHGPASDLVAAINARLDDLEQRSTRKTRPANGQESGQALVRRLEQRLQAIAQQIEQPAGGRGRNHGAGSEALTPPAAPRGTRREAHPAGEPAQDIKVAIAEIANRQQALEHEFDHAVASYADRVDHRMDMVADRLERRLEEHSPEASIRDLGSEIRAIAARLDSDRGTAVTDLREQLIDLLQRLEEVPARVAETIAPRLEDTARRLDTATRSEFDAIRAEMREIAQDIDRVTQSGFDSLRGDIARLHERFDEPARIDASGLEARLNEADRAEFAAIRDEIRNLARELDGARKEDHAALLGEIAMLAERVSEPAGTAQTTLDVRLDDSDRAELAAIRQEIRSLAGDLGSARQEDYRALREDLRSFSQNVDGTPPDRIDELERHLARLVERLESSAAAEDDTAMVEIERQIARLADGLDLSSDRTSAMAALEDTIVDMFRRIQEDSVSSEAIAALKTEFVQLRADVEGSHWRTQDTLGAVHETLNKIVDRLTDLEADLEEVSEERRHAPPAPSLNDSANDDEAPEANAPAAPEPQLDADDLVGRIEAVARAFGKEVEDHTPLAPGSGPPEPAGGRKASGAEHREPARGAQESFIAAARRAAQAANAEQFADSEADDGNSGHGFGTALRKYRRSLIIAAAIVAMAAGAATLVSGFGGASSSNGASALTTPDEPAASEDQSARVPADTDVETAPTRTVDLSRATGQSSSSPDADQAEAPAPQPLSLEDFSAVVPSAGPAEAPPQDEPSTQADAADTGEAPPAEIGPQALRDAAAAGDPAAQFEIAARYTDGQGVAQDLVQAAHWYRLAAGQGLAPAQYRLGTLYEKGHGVTRDTALARMWYQRAAEQGNRKAMHNLAVIHAEGVDGKPDYEQAAVWFRQASDYGLKDSQYNLGVLHGRGMGVKEDLAQAYRWFSLAAAQGDSEAASKRDQVAARLDEQALAAARLGVQSWEAKPLIAEANFVPKAEGWVEEATAQALPSVDGPDLIRQAQAQLARLGYGPGPVDGQIGTRTREAVLRFQRENGLPETGDVTPALLAELSQAPS